MVTKGGAELGCLQGRTMVTKCMVTKGVQNWAVCKNARERMPRSIMI